MVENGMGLADFRVGGEFICGGRRWRCTDIDSRVIVAIPLEHDDDPSWYKGPSFAVAETVFDEDDHPGCQPVPADQPGREPPKEAAHPVEQARALEAQAHEGGLRFGAYLLPGLAGWVLELVEQGVFLDPSEAVFAILSEHKELALHADLRQEILWRSLQAAIDDPRPAIPHDEATERIRRKLADGRPLPSRPWTVAGLLAKRQQLQAVRFKLEHVLRKVASMAKAQRREHHGRLRRYLPSELDLAIVTPAHLAKGFFLASPFS